MPRIAQSPQQRVRGRVEREYARRVKVAGRLRCSATRCAIRLKEQIVVVELAPGQTLVVAGGARRDGREVQVIAQTHAVARSLELRYKLPLPVSPIDAQGDGAGSLQGQPDGDGR